jgi:acyl transferase domain-containing protein/acyl carrier protein
MPLADHVDEFWDNIKNGIDCVRELPQDRKQDANDYYRMKNDRDESVAYLECAYLDDVDKFDYEFFRLTPQEANLMSPVHRMVLQTAWSAFEDAGYSSKSLSGSNTGIYLGFIGDLEGYKYKEIIEKFDPDSLPLSVAGNLASMIPGRIAYFLNLKGPSVLVDTACSSSLVSVDHACRAIRAGVCDMAIAGGARLSLLPIDQENQKIGIESHDNATRTFDEQASGSGLGEGIGMVVLKPLDKAIRDRDHIYAVIKGSAINQDGTSMGITAPNPASQEGVVVRAWQDAGIDPETVSYVEVHGTATKLGDTIEMDGLKAAFRKYTDKNHFCAISSVKTNIGHLYESAGIAGLVKAVMALKHKQLPPSIHFGTPNKKIDFHDSPVYINTKLREWRQNEGPRRCGVSSFGISGTNCHIVLEEAPPTSATRSKQGPCVFAVSAKSKEALATLLERHEQHLREQEVVLIDVCYTATVGRTHFPVRLALLVESVEELQEQLARCRTNLDNCADADVFYGTHRLIRGEREHRLPGEITEQEQEAQTREVRRFVQEKLRTGSLDRETLQQLCAMYVQGGDPDWSMLYRESTPQRLSLPIYPFRNNRCWVPVPHEKRSDARKPEHFFSLIWKPETVSTAKAATSQRVLLFLDSKGIGEQLADRYRVSGREVITVRVGMEYRKTGATEFTITGAVHEYRQLLTELSGYAFDQIIHLMAVGQQSADENLSNLNTSQKLGAYSLFHLTRALANAGIEREIDLALIAEYVNEVTGGEAQIRPENAPLFGLGKVVRKEHPNLQCRCLDVDEYTSVDSIFEELEAVCDTYQVAFRANGRFVEEFAALDLDRVESRELAIKQDGVYLITGGTGGIGLEVARYLAGKNRVRLVLVNRSKMPAREQWTDLLQRDEDRLLCQKIRDLQALEALGAVVECYSVDVANLEELNLTLEAVRDKFGKIDGIVHAAGVGGVTDLVDRSLEDFHEVFAPKVQGTWNLDRLTRQDAPDFLLLFSSIATIFSAAGQGDYTAANSYQDAYSIARNKQGLRTITINWSTWKERGMAANQGFAIDTLFKAITSEQAITDLDLVLQREVCRVLIGEINYEWQQIESIKQYRFRLSSAIRTRLEQRKKGASKPKVRSSAPSGEVKLMGRDQADYSEIERKIAQICQDTLGFAEINIYDSFFELGADSILLKRMHAEFEKEFPGKIAVADIFEHSTIQKLSEFIMRSDEQVPVVKAEPKAVDVDIEQGVSDLLGEMEKGNLSLDQLVDSLSKM